MNGFIAPIHNIEIPVLDLILVFIQAIFLWYLVSGIVLFVVSGFYIGISYKRKLDSTKYRMDKILLQTIYFIVGKRIKHSYPVMMLKQISLIVGWFFLTVSFQTNSPYNFFLGLILIFFGYL